MIPEQQFEWNGHCYTYGGTSCGAACDLQTRATQATTERRRFRQSVAALVLVALAWVAFLVFCGLTSGCGSVATPPCVEQLAPGDTAELSWPCPNAPGYSYGCTGSPSQAPLVDCEIDDGKVHHFRTTCVQVCP